jgi:predicted amidophosphoribosyltransferase
VPLPVISSCTYLTSVDRISWRPCDYDVHDFVHAIKDKPINGFAQIPVRGIVHRLDDTNRDRALVWFGQMIADAAPQHGLGGSIALVPVPNSWCASGGTEVPRTLALAHALAVELNTLVPATAVVVDVLRWSEALVAAHAGGGTRNAQYLFDRCRVMGDQTAAPGRRIVLVDDVVASGGHLRACAARLLVSGCRVDLVVVAGRADQSQVGEPFSVRVDEIADFAPARERP